MSLGFSLPATPSKTQMISQDARIALPPTHGANLNAAEMVALVSGAVACTWTKYQPTAGRLDHGPVHAATTTTSTANGIQASSTSPVVRPCSRSASRASSAALTGMPPWPRMRAGRQTFSSSSNAQKQTMEPVTSGRYGPK